MEGIKFPLHIFDSHLIGFVSLPATVQHQHPSSKSFAESGA